LSEQFVSGKYIIAAMVFTYRQGQMYVSEKRRTGQVTRLNKRSVKNVEVWVKQTSKI
jgi:hypothetical protein